ELETDVIALRRLDLRFGGERRALPAAHPHQLARGPLLELQAQLRERGLERGQVVDLRLHLREVAHAPLPPASISILRPASPPAVVPSLCSAIASRLNWPGSRPRRLRWMAAMSRRSGGVGRSTKKISSNRPLRIISGGSSSTLLAVAITNTGLVFSCSQVMKL